MEKQAKSTKIDWSGFSKKTITERLEHLENNHLLSTETPNDLKENTLLSLETANQLTENVLGIFLLLSSVAPDFQADGTTFNVSTVTEESSVIAAVSLAVKIIKRSGGFETKTHSRKTIGQVTLYDMVNKVIAEETILNHSAQLLTLANEAHPSIVKRGGGAKESTIEEKDEFLIVYLTVDI